MDDRVSSPLSQQQLHQPTTEIKPYKPKFHNASLYTKDDQKVQNNPATPQKQQQQLQSYPSAATTSSSAPITTNITHPLVSSLTFNLFSFTNGIY